MNKEKVVISPANNFGITIKESDIPMGKVVVNGVEVTDIESWNKAIQTFSKLEMELEEKDKEIERLNKECDTYMKIATKRGNIIDEYQNKEVTRLNNIILNRQKRIDKTIQAIDEILIYNDLSDTTSAFGNAPRELKFYLSECDTLEEFDKLKELKEGNKDE